MAVTIDAMTDPPQARRRLARLGVRMLAAGVLAGSVAAVAVIVMHLPKHGTSAPAASGPSGSGPADPWGVSQPGYREIDAPLATALGRLPVRVVLPAAAGKPAGVYTAVHGARVRYGSGSRYGVFLLTVSGRKYGLRARRIRALALGCRSCSDNRLILLAPGVRGAIAVGGRPSTITWRENGRTFEVRGPATSFSEARAIAAARAIARANA
jgi:hypothetical protein